MNGLWNPMPTSEFTPLLQPAEDDFEDGTKAVPYVPLPKLQLAVACLVRTVDPVAFSQIFPYINEFVERTGITHDPARVGLYSGLIESAFSVAQLCSVYHWAKLSDTIGRRPIIIVGFIGVIVSTLAFGLSKSLAFLLIGRAICGLFSGTSAAINSTFAELIHPTNQARAYPIYGICWPIGTILGSFIGGRLSNAATKYTVFDLPFFRAHPYFLPCLATSAIAGLGVVYVLFVLEETLPQKQTEDKTVETPSQTATMRQILSNPMVSDLCASGFALSFLATSHEVLFALFCFSPVETGGLAFPPSRIGDILAVTGAVSIPIQLFITPVLMRRFAMGKLYSVCMATWPWAFLILPATNYVVWLDMGNLSKALMWIGLSISLLLTRIGTLGYTFSLVLTKDHARSDSLGTTNAIVHASMCLARAFCPVLSSSLFAWSVNSDVAGGYWWALAMAGACVYGMHLTERIRHGA